MPLPLHRSYLVFPHLNLCVSLHRMLSICQSIFRVLLFLLPRVRLDALRFTNPNFYGASFFMALDTGCRPLAIAFSCVALPFTLGKSRCPSASPILSLISALEFVFFLNTGCRPFATAFSVWCFSFYPGYV